jgi:hypothetical protein
VHDTPTLCWCRLCRLHWQTHEPRLLSLRMASIDQRKPLATISQLMPQRLLRCGMQGFRSLWSPSILSFSSLVAA